MHQMTLDKSPTFGDLEATEPLKIALSTCHKRPKNM